MISSVAYKSPDLVSFLSSRYHIAETDCSCAATAATHFMCVHFIIPCTIAELSNHSATCHDFSKPEPLMNAQLLQHEQTQHVIHQGKE